MAKILNILIGIPGVGKSTYIANNKKEKDSVISSDEFRKQLFGDLQSCQNPKSNQLVFSLMEKQLRNDLVNSKIENIFYDATNLNRKRRINLFKIAKSVNKKVIIKAITFIEPLNIVLKQNANRNLDNYVPEDVVKSMYSLLEVPRLKVDCDEIVVVNNNSMEVEYIHQPIMEHDSPYHKETVQEHIQLTINNSTTEQLKEIAKWHDLGKFVTKQIKVNSNPASELFYKKTNNFQSNFINHEKVSAFYYLANNKNNLTPEVLDNLEVIFQHMNNPLTEKIINRNLLSDELVHLIEEFHKVDKMSAVKHEFIEEYLTILKGFKQ